jgi:hypothetical protein
LARSSERPRPVRQTESDLATKGGLPGIKDQVDLTLASGAVVRIYDLGGRGGEVCYIGRWDNVHELHQYLPALMSRYYPVPYPSH